MEINKEQSTKDCRGPSYTEAFRNIYFEFTVNEIIDQPQCIQDAWEIGRDMFFGGDFPIAE